MSSDLDLFCRMEEFFMYTRNDLRVIRSDQGDGGWSIHLKDDEDLDGIPSRYLATGMAEMVDDEWNRPTEADFDRVLANLNSVQ